MLTGTYTASGSEGIYVYDFNTKNGTAYLLHTAKTSNPSFLAIAPNEKFVYAVNENANTAGNGGMVTSFAFDKKKLAHWLLWIHNHPKATIPVILRLIKRVAGWQ